MANLLIVDDEDDVREFAANFFRRRKINVLTASCGEDTLSILEKEAPDLILLDIKMTGMDGIETLRRIREKGSNVKVIMVTGKKPDEDDSIGRCKEYGVAAYIHKPLELDELEKTVMKELL
jgi:two-component system response regulator (stage 0 sporulation protein F)